MRQLQKYVLDASAFIEIRRSRQLRDLARSVRRGQVFVPVYVLKKLEKARSCRDWVSHNGSRVRTNLVGQEHDVYANLIVQHGSWSSNPRLENDDIMAIAMAYSRALPLVMRDKSAERVARALGVRVLSVREFLEELTGRPGEKLL